MGRWRAFSLLLNHISTASTKCLTPNKSSLSLRLTPLHLSLPSTQTLRVFLTSTRPFSAIPSRVLVDTTDYDYGYNNEFVAKEDEETGKIPIKAYFLCTRFAQVSTFSLISQLGLAPFVICLCGSDSILCFSMHSRLNTMCLCLCVCERECVFDVGFYEIIVSGVLCFVLLLLICVNFMYVKVKIIDFYRGWLYNIFIYELFTFLKGAFLFFLIWDSWFSQYQSEEYASWEFKQRSPSFLPLIKLYCPQILWFPFRKCCKMIKKQLDAFTWFQVLTMFIETRIRDAKCYAGYSGNASTFPS